MNLRRVERTRDGRMLAAFAAVMMVFVCSAAAFGQCTLTGTVSTWNDGNSNWNNAANWKPSGVPNSPSTSVCITNGTSAVNLDINASVDNLQLARGNTLSFNGNTQFSVFGTQMINAGSVLINGGGGANTYMFIDNSMTVSGAGTLTLSDTTSGGGNAYLYANNGAATLTNQSTIQGEGILGDNTALTINNQSGGIINANSSGGALATTLVFQTAVPDTNAGLMEATNSGVLLVQSTTINNSGGNITANGSKATVELNGADIQGGTLNTLSSGTLGSFGTGVTLDGSTHGSLTLNSGSTYTAQGNSQTAVLGTITNQGNIQLNGGGGANTYLFVGGNTTLQGGGTVTMNTPTSGGGNTYIYQTASGLTLTNVNNTFQGEGVFGNGTGLAIVNQSGGTINANSTGGGTLNTVLQVDTTGGITNQGLMEASNSGTLEISATTVNNAGGTIKANTGAVVQLDGGTVIQGGTLTANGGTVQTVGAATLDGSTSAGAVTLSGTYTGASNSQTSIRGTINVNNNLQVNGGGGANTYLFAIGNTTLQGKGTVTLSDTTAGGGNAYFYSNAGAVTLTNVNDTIQGSGILGDNTQITLVNQSGGTINANSMGSPLANTLLLQAAGSGGNPGVVNQGLMEATNSGVLLIQGMTVNNAGGNITANGATATVELNGADIQGGTLNTLNSGTFENISSGTTLDGTTQGALTLSKGSTFTGAGNSQTAIFGTFNNNGNIQINGGGGTNTYLFVNGNTTLQNGGTVTLSNTVSGGGNAYFYANNGATTLTNVNNTIQGEGIFGDGTGLTVVNQASGIINANSAGGALSPTLLFNPGATATNQGLMEATNGGVLLIQSTTINNKGGNITANGATATVELNAADIQGGTLNTLNSGTVENIGSSTTLDGKTQGAMTLNGTFTGVGNSQTSIFGTFTNNGNIQLNGGGGANTYMFVNGNTTLQGNGKGLLNLNNTVSGGGNTYLYANNGATTLTNTNNTIEGAGIIGNGTAFTIINNSGGTILANLSGQTLLLNGSAPVTNNGTLNAAAGSTLELTSSLTNFTNTANGTLTGGTYNATGTIQFGSSGTTIQTDNAKIILNGATAQLINLGGQNLLTPLSSIGAASSFSLQGGANFTTAGNLTLNSTGTLTVGSGSTFNVNGNLTDISGTTISGGTYNVTGTLKANNASGITVDSAKITLTGSAAKFQNQSGVNALTGLTTISSGDSFTINSGANFTTAGNFTNNGTLAAGASNSKFDVNGNLTNFISTTNTLTGGTYNVTGTLQFNSANIVVNAANITMTGTSSQIINQSSANGLANFATNNAGASFTINSGRNFTTASNFTNNGTLTVGASNSKFDVNGNLTNFNSTTNTLTGGTYNLTGTLQFNSANVVTNAANITLTGTSSQIIDQSSANGLANFATNASTGSFTVAGGRVFTTAGAFTNAGALTVTGSGSKFATGGSTNFTNNGTLTTASGAKEVATGSTGSFTDNGTLTVGSGTTFNTGGSLTNLSGTTLSGGTYSISGTMQYNSTSDIATNSANITLTGSGAKIIDSSSKNALTGLASNTSTGKFTVTGGQLLSDTATAFSNAGTVTVGKSSKLTLTGTSATYTQTAGTTTVDGTLTAKGITVSGGSVFGNGGTFSGNTTNSGTFNIGDAANTAGKETITGTYTQNSAGALDADIGGATAGTLFDQLTVSSAASLNGTLNLDLINAFVPTIGQTFDILNASSVAGTFTTVNGTSINSSEHFSVVYNSKNVTLDVVSGMAPTFGGALAANVNTRTPEPGSLLLLGTGLVGLAGFARRWRAPKRAL
jgi:fibronectin-binding autotransporter adhesin